MSGSIPILIPRSQIGLCAVTMGKAGFFEMIEAAAAAGFGAVSISMHQYRTAIEAGATPEALRRALRDAGLRVTMLEAVARGLPGVPEPDQLQGRARALLLPGLEDCLEVSATLEAEAICVVHLFGQPTPPMLLIDALGAMSLRAGRHGVDLAIEFLPDSGIPDLATALGIVAAVNHASLGILLDSWHLLRRGGSAADIRAMPISALKAVQINDGPANIADLPYVPGVDRLLPGEGDFPLRDIVEAVLQKWPGMNLGIEVPSAALRALPPVQAAAAVMESAGRLLTLRDHR